MNKSKTAFAAAICLLGFCGAVSAAWVFGWAVRHPSAAGCAGTLLAGLGLWIAAWECGRRFEREHGGRACGSGAVEGESISGLSPDPRLGSAE